MVEMVRERGVLRCGAATRQSFVNVDEHGRWDGLEVDLCRAIAAAVLRDADAIQVEVLGGDDRFSALKRGDIDVLFATSTWTYGRDTSLGVTFVGTFFYDGQAFMTHRSLGVSSLKDLRDAKVCASVETTTKDNLEEYIRTQNPTLSIVSTQAYHNIHLPFMRRDCQVLTDDATGLMSMRATLMGDPRDYVILPERISKEPLGAVVIEGDPLWFQIVRWTLFGLIAAEEKGITKVNADKLRHESRDAEVRRMLGADDFGKSLNLDPEWLLRIIKHVGNYGEIYERALGSGSIYKLDRGLNALWTQGGLLYAPPFR